MQAVEFEHSSAKLSSGSHGLLNQIVGIMDEYPDYRIEISGHTDSTGADAFNQKLSEQRAKSCYDFLVGQGVSARRVSFVGHGETMPIADNNTQDGRQLNRRVEFNMIPGLN
jgi:outer membrane protein OmpA-like peptidoglycan-associated protein